MYPFIWLPIVLYFSQNYFGLEPAKESELAHSEEELRLILGESFKSGEINQTEYKYVNNIFEFDLSSCKRNYGSSYRNDLLIY